MEQNRIFPKLPPIIFCLFLTFVFTSGAYATTYYVSTDGNDSNSGTYDSPWRTIGKAASTMIGGDNVIVSAGTYQERINQKISGNSGGKITFRARTGDRVICRGFNIQADYIVIDGFEITYLNPFQNRNYRNGSGVYVASGAKYCEIKNCLIHYCTWGGIMLYQGSSYCSVYNNRLYDNKSWGICVMGSNHSISGNEIWESRVIHPDSDNMEFDADGIRYFGSGHTFTGNYIHNIDPNAPKNTGGHVDGFQTFPWNEADNKSAWNCTFEGNRINLPYVGTSGWMLNGSSAQYCENIIFKNNIIRVDGGCNTDGGFCRNLYWYNNTIMGSLTFDNYRTGIQLVDCPNSVVKNNIIVDFIFAELLIQGERTGIVQDYNLFYRSDGSDPNNTDGPQPHDLWNTNPMFVDVSGGNYHLRSNSPCRDTGDTATEVSIDYDGYSRPWGRTFDIGAYEFRATISPPTNLRIIN